MAVFIREVHHLPTEDRDLLDERQRALIGRWRTLLAQAHPEWDGERVRTAVHGAFGMLNAVGTFESPLTDRELAAQLAELAVSAMQVDRPHIRTPDGQPSADCSRVSRTRRTPRRPRSPARGRPRWTARYVGVGEQRDLGGPERLRRPDGGGGDRRAVSASTEFGRGVDRRDPGRPVADGGVPGGRDGLVPVGPDGHHLAAGRAPRRITSGSGAGDAACALAPVSCSNSNHQRASRSTSAGSSATRPGVRRARRPGGVSVPSRWNSSDIRSVGVTPVRAAQPRPAARPSGAVRQADDRPRRAPARGRQLDRERLSDQRSRGRRRPSSGISGSAARPPGPGRRR